jgi:hypothetical protein
MESERWFLYGVSNPEVLVCGHSHAYSMVRGAEMSIRDGAAVGRAVAYSSASNNGAAQGDDYWKFVQEKSSAGCFAVVWNGNQHNIDFLFEQVPPLDIVPPHGVYANPPADAKTVVRRAVESYFEPSMSELTIRLRELTRIARVIVVGTPAPKSTDHVLRALKNDPYFAALPPRDSNSPGVAREPLRVALWMIIQDMLRVSAESAGATFLPSPEDSVDSSGLLKEEFSSADATHANSEYGDLVWRDLLSEHNRMVET